MRRSPRILDSLTGDITVKILDPIILELPKADVFGALLDGIDDPILGPLLDFTASYTSGILLGLVGPVLGPIVALVTNGIEAFDHLVEGEFESAFGALLSIPAAMANAFLNGGETLDLTPVLSLLSGVIDVEVPDGISIGLALGGLLSPGGSLLNALDVRGELDLGDIGLGQGIVSAVIPGQGPSAIGSLIGLSQAIAKAIGWSGSGNPLEDVDLFDGLPTPSAVENGPEQVPLVAGGPEVNSFTMSPKELVTNDVLSKSPAANKNPDPEPVSLTGVTEKPAKEEASEEEAPEETLKTEGQSEPDASASAGQAEDNTPTKTQHRFKRFKGSTGPAPVSATETGASVDNSDTTPKKRWHKKRNGGSNNSE